MTKPIPQPGILDIALYQGGASSAPGVSNVVKLSSNENPFGPSEAAVKAVAVAAHQMHRYPEIDGASLRAALAAHYDLDADRIALGVGSDEILSNICNGYAGPGDEVIYTEHGFSMYRICALASGATPVVVPENQRVVDVDNILAACTDKTRVIFVTNPGNPTGTFIPVSELERLADAMPAQAVLVIDGAYEEYAEGYEGGAELAASRPNVVMTRTFSKLFGLGGMRVGWAYADRAIIDVLNRLRNPFNLSTIAIEAAKAALADTAHTKRCLTENARLRAWLSGALEAHGVMSDRSGANFVLARFDDEDEANACEDYLRSQGLLVRRVAGYGLPNCLRITVGDEPSCRRVAHAIGAFKGGARA
ncbi:histidinol-phosphate transaminase [Donghicola tyrosinivorans]|uniref:Histidinol-phosphate aminotransferase n=1 Tax=Donghicola tyrosinivorans TaxID=1652492 RepID=A0A2T0X0C6_9RHOB|nr:histidinol-phosphate transaminase [Donghicola tyrosinivorans]PRY92403.1 histidinol-phosphate aminotransferase [Donghicola tyrosinivorans]